jgi:hypothetical protein
MVDQIRFQNDASGRLDQSLQDIECTTAQGNHRAVNAQLAVSDINLKSDLMASRLIGFQWQAPNYGILRFPKIFSDSRQSRERYGPVC